MQADEHHSVHCLVGVEYKTGLQLGASWWAPLKPWIGLIHILDTCLLNTCTKVQADEHHICYGSVLISLLSLFSNIKIKMNTTPSSCWWALPSWWKILVNNHVTGQHQGAILLSTTWAMDGPYLTLIIRHNGNSNVPKGYWTGDFLSVAKTNNDWSGPGRSSLRCLSVYIVALLHDSKNTWAPATINTSKHQLSQVSHKFDSSLCFCRDIECFLWTFRLTGENIFSPSNREPLLVFAFLA